MRRWAQRTDSGSPPFPISHESSADAARNDEIAHNDLSRGSTVYPDRGDQQGDGRSNLGNPIYTARPGKPDPYDPRDENAGENIRSNTGGSADENGLKGAREGSGEEVQLEIRLKSLGERLGMLRSQKSGNQRKAPMANGVARALARRNTPDPSIQFGASEKDLTTSLCTRCLRLGFHSVLGDQLKFPRKSRSMDDALAVITEDAEVSSAPLIQPPQHDLDDILVWGEFGDDLSGLEAAPKKPASDSGAKPGGEATARETSAKVSAQPSVRFSADVDLNRHEISKSRSVSRARGARTVFSEQLAAEIVAHEHSKTRLESCRHTIALLSERNKRVQEDLANAAAITRDREDVAARKLKAQQLDFEDLSKKYAALLQENAKQRSDVLFKASEATRKHDTLAAQLREIQGIIGRGQFDSVQNLTDAILSAILPVRPDELDESGTAKQPDASKSEECNGDASEILRERDEARSKLQDLELQTAYMAQDWQNTVEHLQKVHLIETTRLRDELAAALSQAYSRNTVSFAATTETVPSRKRGGSEPTTPRRDYMHRVESRQKSVAFLDAKSVALSPNAGSSPSKSGDKATAKVPLSPSGRLLFGGGSRRSSGSRVYDASPRNFSRTSASLRSSQSSNSTTGSVWLDDSAEPGTVYGMSMEAQLHRALEREEELEHDLLCLEMEIEDLKRRFRNDEDMKELLAELIECKLSLASASEENLALRNDVRKLTSKRRATGRVSGLVAGGAEGTDDVSGSNWLSLLVKRKTTKVCKTKDGAITYAPVPASAPGEDPETPAESSPLLDYPHESLSGAGKAAMILGSVDVQLKSADGVGDDEVNDKASESSFSSLVEAQLG